MSALALPRTRLVAARPRARALAARLPLWAQAGGLAAAAALVYALTSSWRDESVYPMLARALVAGQLSVPATSGVELVPLGDGRAYTVAPPIPALFHIPGALLGFSIPEPLMAALFAGAAVGLAYLVALRVGAARLSAVAIAAGLGASTLWWVARSGTMWHFAHTVAVAGSLAALYLALSRRWPLAAGLALGIAAGSRLPVGLALPVLAYLYGRHWRAQAALIAGVVAVALPVALFNAARFGSPLEFGYALLPSGLVEGSVLGEPWYKDGILSLSYIPRSLGAMLLSGFEIRNDAPWVLPSGMSLSLIYSAPIYLLALRAPWSRLTAVLWAGVLLVMLPDWAHGAWGFWQYGYRFILDAAPLLVVLLALAFRERTPWWLWAASAAGAASTVWGILCFVVWRVYP